MRTIVVVLMMLGAGLFIGSRYEGARTAHRRFSDYRVRTVNGLNTWFKKTVAATAGIVGLGLALYLLYH